MVLLFLTRKITDIFLKNLQSKIKYRSVFTVWYFFYNTAKNNQCLFAKYIERNVDF